MVSAMHDVGMHDVGAWSLGTGSVEVPGVGLHNTWSFFNSGNIKI
jgi:hypothetical protein